MPDGTVLIANLFLWLCKGIYWLAEKAYELLLDIANVQIFDSETLQGFGQRIYVFLGIIMLFKVAFSLINYIINPDSFTDKGKGVGKLVIDIAVVLLLIVSVPFIFEYAMKFQRAVLNQNVIPNLVLGMSNDAEGQFDYGDEGEKMSFTVFSSFFRVNPAIFEEDSECLNGLFESGEVDTESENSYGGSWIMKEECAEVLDAATGTTFDRSIADLISFAYETNNLDVFIDSDIIKAKSSIDDEKVNTFDFMGLIASASGIFLAWIFVMFCFDIAVRTVKLVFLQLIAPVPIVSYIDPKGQKGMFKKWVNTCVKTYLDLFIRLIAVFFAIFVVSQIPKAEIMIPGGEGEKVGGFVYIFLVFGVLLFAKQLPKLLEDITGVKLDGGFTINPMNKFQQIPLIGAATGMAAARLFGGAQAFASDKTNHKVRSFFEGGSAAAHEMRGKIPASGLKSGAQTVRSMTDARKAGYKYVTGSEMKAFSPINSLFSRSGQREFDKLKSAKGSLKQQQQFYEDKIGSSMDQLHNIQNTNNELNAQYESLNSAYNAAKDSKERAQIMLEMNNIKSTIGSNNSRITQFEDDIAANREALKATTDAIEWHEDQMKDISGRYSSVDASTKKSFEDINSKLIAKTGMDLNDFYKK